MFGKKNTYLTDKADGQVLTQLKNPLHLGPVLEVGSGPLQDLIKQALGRRALASPRGVGGWMVAPSHRLELFQLFCALVLLSVIQVPACSRKAKRSAFQGSRAGHCDVDTNVLALVPRKE